MPRQGFEVPIWALGPRKIPPLLYLKIHLGFDVSPEDGFYKRSNSTSRMAEIFSSAGVEKSLAGFSQKTQRECGEEEDEAR